MHTPRGYEKAYYSHNEALLGREQGGLLELVGECLERMGQEIRLGLLWWLLGKARVRVPAYGLKGVSNLGFLISLPRCGAEREEGEEGKA